jgi:adenosylcobinamide-phosphate synthase
LNATDLAPIAAYVLDRAFGEPPNAVHPVAWMGRAIALGRRWALRAGRVGQLARGAVVALLVPGAAALVACVTARALGHAPAIAPIAIALLLKPLFAVRALRDAAFAVRDALAGNDLEAARRGLGALCSRPATSLGPSALAAATIESVAENASDSIVAPLLFFAVFGLPGAAFYRAVNTLDAMMGYRGHLEYAGKASARLDDVLNFVPARVTALLLIAAGRVAGADACHGVRVLWRDGGRTASPNAGRPMAAMAGLLGVRLEKEGHYALGDAARPIEADDITAAWRITSLASIGAVGLAVAVGWALHG